MADHDECFGGTGPDDNSDRNANWDGEELRYYRPINPCWGIILKIVFLVVYICGLVVLALNGYGEWVMGILLFTFLGISLKAVL